MPDIATLFVVKKEDLQLMPELDRMFSEPECRAMTTLYNSTRWRMEQEGKFPKRIKIGPSAVAYRLSEMQN